MNLISDQDCSAAKICRNLDAMTRNSVHGVKVGKTDQCGKIRDTDTTANVKKN